MPRGSTTRTRPQSVSLKEANRLANNNQQDEAIALLAKTIEDNPGYEAAGIRLMSMLEHTALPTGIEKIHSTDDEINEEGTPFTVPHPEHDLFVEHGRRADNSERYRLFKLSDGELIKEWSSEYNMYGQMTEDGNFFCFIESG